MTREKRQKNGQRGGGGAALKTGLALACAALVGGAVFAASADEPTATYCVIDLSAGADATSYPVSYLDAVPEGGWTDEYKTTKLVLRRCPAGADPLGDYTLTKNFYAGVFEVTEKQWELVMGANPSEKARGDNYPVECTSYNDIRGRDQGAHWPESSAVDATSFLGKLRAKTGIEALDLPTEAQWEYACRAGTTTRYNTGEKKADLEAAGWYDKNSEDQKHPVGEKAPNDWGLYDMHGNVWEWCLDWKGGGLSGEDPVGASFATDRIRSGGAYNSDMALATASSTQTSNPESHRADLGFRLFWTLSAGPRLSLIGDADATITGDAGRGFVIEASQNAETIEVVIPNGVEASKVTVKVPPTVKTVKPNGATIRVVYTIYDMTEDLDFSAARVNGVIDFAKVTVKTEYTNPLGASDAEISLSDPSAPSLTIKKTRKGLRYTLYEGRTPDALKPSSYAWTIGNGGDWSPTPAVKGGTSGFYTIRVDFK